MPSFDVLRTVALTVALVGAAAIDLRSCRIPNGLTAALALFGAGCAALDGGGAFVAGVFAGAASGGAIWGVRGLGFWLFGRPGMGMGDVKLAGAVGLALGWPALWAIYLALLIGGLAAAGGLAAGLVRRETRLPFAPFLLAGFAAGTLVPSEFWV
jgi:leader peptidase (prepilin peptidase)/N-methyltransferase